MIRLITEKHLICCCPRDYHLPMKSNRAFVRNSGKGHIYPRYSCHCDVREPCKEGNRYNLDRDAASDEGLHCLLKVQEVAS